MTFQINSDIAMHCGVKAAILFAIIAFEVKMPQKNHCVFQGGKWWIKVNCSIWSDVVGFISEQKIRRCYERLENDSLILSFCSADVNPENRTMYCTLTDSGEEIFLRG